MPSLAFLERRLGSSMPTICNSAQALQQEPAIMTFERQKHASSAARCWASFSFFSKS